MKAEVYNYSRTYMDPRLGKKVTSISKFKASMEFISRQKMEDVDNSQYRILEDTREIVDADAVIRGKYHPELLSHLTRQNARF